MVGYTKARVVFLIIFWVCFDSFFILNFDS